MVRFTWNVTLTPVLCFFSCFQFKDDLLEHQRLRNHSLPPREEDLMLNVVNASPATYQEGRGGRGSLHQGNGGGQNGAQAGHYGVRGARRLTTSRSDPNRPGFPYSRPSRGGFGVPRGGWGTRDGARGPGFLGRGIGGGPFGGWNARNLPNPPGGHMGRSMRWPTQ